MILSRELRESAASGLLSGALFACGVLLPLVGPPLGFLASTPLIWLTLRRGARAGFLAGLLGAALLLPVVPPPALLFFAGEHFVPGLLVGARLARRGGMVAASALGAGVAAVLVLGAGMLLSTAADVDPAALFQQQLTAAMGELGKPGAVLDGGEGAAAESLRALFAFFGRVFPALLFVGILIEVLVNALLAVRLLARERPAAVHPPALTGFALPERLVWAVLPALAAVWAPERRIATVALNVLIPLLVLYLIQGFSISLHLLARLRLSRFGRLLLALAVLIQPYLLAAPLLLGLLDFRFDFRRRWPLPPPPASPPSA